MLSNAPPIMSLSQCTPETSREITIKAVKKAIEKARILLKILFFISLLNCIIAVGITHIVSKVVEDG